MSTTTLNGSIPTELTELDQWVVWRLEKNGTGKLDKLPYQVHQLNKMASSTDPQTWTTFTEAVDASANFTGIGFVFSKDDPFCGIDLDGCRDPETGIVSEWAANWIDSFNSYTEVSPSKTGVKIYVRGHHTFGDGKTGRKTDLDVDAPPEVTKTPGVEIYDHGRYFAVTGNILDEHTLTTCEPRQEIVNEFCACYFPPYEPKARRPASKRSTDVEERAAEYLAKIPGAVSGSGGHNDTFHVACVLVLGFALTPEQAFPILAEWNATCEPPWTDHELQHKLDDANKEGGERGYLLNAQRDEYKHNGNGRQYDESEAYGHDDIDATPEVESEQPAKPLPKIVTIGKLIEAHPRLRPVVIDGLIRRGDTANIIAPPKVGKTWFAYGIGFSVATGLRWLDRFDCAPGRVLLIDNELDPSDIAWRIPRVAEALGIQWKDYCDNLDVVPLRGHLIDLIQINRLMSTVESGEYSLVIFDAFYRGLPAGVSENDNAAIAGLYNLIDQSTKHLQAAWINIHHSTKGSQGGKSVVDVGAGAGSQSRAADAHIILREHQEPGFAVLDGAVRTFKPIQPVALKWEWPLWKVALEIDPSKLAGLLTRGDERQNAKDAEGCEIVHKMITDSGAATSRQLLSRGIGMGDDRCKRLLGQLEREGKLASTPTIRRGMPCQMYHLPGDVSWCSGHVPEQGDT